MSCEKRQSELKKGDIIHVEFGDYGNWVTVEVDSITPHATFKDYVKILGRSVNNDARMEMYGLADSLCEVLN